MDIITGIIIAAISSVLSGIVLAVVSKSQNLGKLTLVGVRCLILRPHINLLAMDVVVVR